MAVMAALWAAGLAWFKSYINKLQDYSENKTDAIIVLTGGKGRVPEALDILRKGYADRLFISGAGGGATVSEMLLEHGVERGEIDEWQDKVELGHKAENTQQNAAEAAEWIRKSNYKTIRLITSNYHMPRSMLEFENIMPDVEIIPHPVTPEHIKMDEWWKNRGSRNLILSEYHKFLAVKLDNAFNWRGVVGDN